MATSRRVPDGVVAAVVAAVVLAIQLPFRLHAVNLVDEGAILQNGVEILAGRRMYVDVVHPAFPGVHYLMAAAFAVGGATFDTARTMMCVLVAATAAIVYGMGRWWLRPLGALALVVLFVDYRIWAYPHWHMVSYSSLAVSLVLGSAALAGAAFASARGATYAAAGAVAGLAMLTKQDSGLLGTAGVGAAILLAAPEPLRRRIGAAMRFTAGAMAVFAPAVVALAWAGTLPDVVLQTILVPLHGLREFSYQGSPPLWPLWGQDGEVRARAFSYFPSILIDLHWPAIAGSRIWTQTWLPDLAMRLAYHLPWLIVVAAVPFVIASSGGDRVGEVRRARERLVVVLAVACWAAFNRPHDWIHLMVLYPPTLLLLALLVSRLAAGAARRWVLGGATAVLAVATVLSVRIAFDLRRATPAPVQSRRGVIYATPAQAASLQDLVDTLGAAAPPDVPVAPFPYHPIVTFVSARPSFTRYYSIWPGEPDRGRTATVVHDLDARPDGLVVYALTQVPYFRRTPDYAPELTAYLADHYRIDRHIGGQPLGFEFLLLRRSDAPAGRPLVENGLDAVGVVVEPADAPARLATPEERSRLVERTVWPFRRVIRVAADPRTATALRFGLVAGPETHVRTSFAVNPETWASVPWLRPRLSVAVAAGGVETPIAGAVLDPLRVPGDRRWVDVDVDLARWAGSPVEVVLRVAAPDGAPGRYDRAGFAEPRVVP